MNKTLTNLAAAHKSPLLLLLVSALFSFQNIHAQHCNPSFHFTVNGNTVTFEDQSTADGTIIAYNWTFGDGNSSTEQNPTHAYAAPGTYNVCLTITAHNPNCTATFCHHVVVTHPPLGECHAEFIAQQPDPALPTIHFTDQSTSDGIIGSWEWDFGDGSTSTEQNPMHTYPGPGVYLVCLIITDEDGVCTSHVCHHVVIHHPPAGVCHAEFTAEQPNPHHQTIHFTDHSTSDGVIGSWEWDFGDGNTSTEQNPVHTYAEPGTYLVCLTITDEDGGCSSHVCHQVVVHHPPMSNCHAAFLMHFDPTGLIVQFTNTSTGTTNHTTYFWDFGDGTNSTAENPHHTFPHNGHYTVCLFIEDLTTGCSSHICYTIHLPHMLRPHNPFETQDRVKEEQNAGPIEPSAQLLVVYPNPVVGNLKVFYQVSIVAVVKFEVYDLLGVKVIDIAENTYPVGAFTKVIPVGNLSPGEYVLKMTTNGTTMLRSIIVQ